jgi:hypothetical protein
MMKACNSFTRKWMSNIGSCLSKKLAMMKKNKSAEMCGCERPKTDAQRTTSGQRKDPRTRMDQNSIEDLLKT